MADEHLNFNINVRDQGATASLRRLADRFAGVQREMVSHARTARETAGIEEKLSKLEDRHSDALGRVKIAEQNLSEVRGRANAKVSQVVRAEQQLLKARRDSARAAKDVAREVERVATPDGTKSGRSFTTTFRRWMTGRGGKDMESGGRFGASVFGSGFLGALKTPVIGPAIVGVILAAAATVLPAAGAVAGGAVVAGFGAGLVGLAAVFAAKSEAVRTAWKSTLAGMAADLRILSKPFESVLVGLSAVASRTFARLKPELAAAFAGLAPAVAGFGDAIGRAFERIAPAIRPVSQAFAAVLAALGPGLQSAIGSISGGMQRLAASVRANPAALAEFTTGLGELTSTVLGFLALLNDVNGQFKTLTGGTSLVTATMRGLQAALMPLIFPFAELNFALRTLNGWTKPVGDGFHYTATSAEEAATATGYWTQGLSKAQLAAMGITGEAKGVGKAVETLTDKFNRQKAKTDALIESLFRLQNLTLGLSGAQVNLAQATADASQSLKDNGKGLNLNTAAGRANQTALNNLAQATNQETDAMIRSGKGTDAAGIAAGKSRSNFVRLAQQMGATKPQAEAMARSMIAIPNVSRTAKLKADKADLDAKLAAAKRQLADKGLTATKRAKLEATIAQLQDAVARAKAAIAGVQGKTVTLKLVTERIAKTVSGASGGHVPTEKRAAGGPVRAGVPYIVGEKRPELFIPNINGMIVPRVPSSPSYQSSVMSTRATGGTTININVAGAVDRTNIDTLLREIRKAVRGGGGNVQTVLGPVR